MRRLRYPKLLMPLLQAIVLGIIQGLTEFLPISSSAHLIVIPKLLGWPEQGLAFDIALHVGTLAAVILYFFRDWMQIVAQGFGMRVGGDSGLQRNRGLLWLLALATIPAGVAGLLFQKKIEGAIRDNLYVIGAMAILIGIVMWLAENAGTQAERPGPRFDRATRFSSASRKRWHWSLESPAAELPCRPGCFETLNAEPPLAFPFCC